MVLIFSMELELSTNEVIDWLEYSNTPYIRMNEDITNLASKLVLDGNGNKTHSFNNINLNEIKSIWYRRSGKFNMDKWFDINALTSEIYHHLKEELLTTKYAFLNSIFRNKKSINTPFNSHLNKVQILEDAADFNIKIPFTIICTDKKMLLESLEISSKRYIVKPINKVKDLELADGKYFQLTKELTIENIEKLGNNLFPCIIQEFIPKSFEVRTFFLNEKFYSMAMFSQDNPKTAMDFRNYDYENPNRRVPFQLDISLENKLRLLLKKTGLNCASLDILRGTDGEYYFLEINPVGQFGMVSYPCNYFLEKEIANYLKEDL